MGEGHEGAAPRRLSSHIYEAPDQGLASPPTVGSPPMLTHQADGSEGRGVYDKLPNDYATLAGKAVDGNGNTLCKVCGRPALKNKHGNCKMCYQALYQDANKLSKSKRVVIPTGESAVDLHNFAEAVKGLRNGCRNDHKCPPSFYRFDLDPRKKCMRCHTLACIREFPELALRVQKVTVGNMQRKREAAGQKRQRPHDYAAPTANKFPAMQHKVEPDHPTMQRGINGVRHGGIQLEGIDHVHGLNGTNGLSADVFPGLLGAEMFGGQSPTCLKHGSPDFPASPPTSQLGSPQGPSSPANEQQRQLQMQMHQQRQQQLRQQQQQQQQLEDIHRQQLLQARQMQALGMQVPDLGSSIDFMTGPNMQYQPLPRTDAVNLAGPYNKGMIDTAFGDATGSRSPQVAPYAATDIVLGRQDQHPPGAVHRLSTPVTSLSQLEVLDLDDVVNLQEVTL